MEIPTGCNHQVLCNGESYIIRHPARPNSRPTQGREKVADQL